MTMEMPIQRPDGYETMLYNMKMRAGTRDAFSQETYKDMAEFASGAQERGATSRARMYAGWKDSDFADFLAEAKAMGLVQEEE